MGRKKEYTTEILKKIIQSFFDDNIVQGQVSASQLAEYANEKLGFEKVRYNTFTRDEEIKKFLDEINNSIPTVINENKGESKYSFIKFNTDRFLDTYKNDEKMQRVVLRNFSNRYEKLNREVIELDKKNNNLNLENEALNKKVEKLKKEKKELKNKVDLLSTQNSNLKKFKRLDERLVLFDSLKQRGLVSELDYDNIRMMLINSGIIKGEDLVSSEEVDKNYASDLEVNIDDTVASSVLSDKDEKEQVKKGISILDKIK